MLILGVDPGLVNTGWSVIEFDKSSQSKIVDNGLITTNACSKISSRLLTIFNSLHQHLDKYDIDSAALEKTLVNKNAISSMDLSMGRSVILLYFGQRNLEYTQYFPTFIKKSITGNGRAEKEQLRDMLPNYLKSEFKSQLCELSHHEIDSTAIAICHGFSMNNVLLS